MKNKYTLPTLTFVFLAISGFLAAIFMNHLVAFICLSAIPMLLIFSATGAWRMVPKDRYGLLYFSALLLTSVAPILGVLGTASRFGLAIVSLYMLLSLLKTQHVIPTQVVFPLSILLVCSLTAAAIGAPSIDYGFSRLLNWVMFVPLMFLYIRKPSESAIVSGFVLGGVLQMMGVALQGIGVLGGTWGGLILSGDAYDASSAAWLTRYTGFILDPNNLGLWLVLASLGAIYNWRLASHASGKLLALFLLILFSYGIFLTGSRGALVALVIGVICQSSILGRKGLAFAFFFVAVTALAVIISSSEGLDRLIASLADIISGSDFSAATRTDRWIDQLSSQHNVLFGSGFGSYAADSIASQTGLFVSADAARAATIDNGWLKLYLECGLVGVLALGTLIITALRRGVILRKSPGQRPFAAFIVAGVVVFLWRSLSIDILDLNPWNAVLFLLIAAAVARTPYSAELVDNRQRVASDRAI